MQKLIILSLAVLMILSSCKLKDSTSSSTNPVEPGTGDVTITVVAPNGGESLSEGSSYQIQWTGTGTLLVRIQYSIDNGTSWGLVVDSLSNTGVYNWFPVPNTISNQCRIMITSSNGISSDQSDKVFAIVKNSNESLKINSPNGGESWEAGSAKQIKWYSSGIDSVRIEYTTDNGLHWNFIAIDKKNTGIFYWEPVPNTPSTLAKVRIMDAKDGAPSTESTNTFMIDFARTIKVKLPNGGEKFIAGTSKRIEYEAGYVDNVKISYSTNGGYNWVQIVESTPAINFYTWDPLPNVNSANCLIRIDNANGGLPTDVSDSVFTITNQLSKSVKVIYPNGGERWIAGSTQNIAWEADGIQNIKIEFTTNSGITWNTVAANTPNTKAYAWNLIPNVSSDNCKIRVSDASDATFFDESDNFYSMTPTPTLTVTSPNGGEYWQSGSNQEIRWVSENIPNVKIEFTSDGGANWNTLIDSTTTNPGSYTWLNIPNMNSLQCKIKITDAKYGSPTDQSDNNFTISNQVTKSIKVLSPNGGEDWEAGTKQNITWSSSSISKVKVELTTDKGSKWTVLADSITGGAFEWNISELLNSTQCQIRLSDANDDNVNDVSDAIFTISPRKWIVVTGPPTKIYKSNEPVTITWLSSGIKNVGIKYTATGGVADISNPAFTDLAIVGAANGSFTTYFSRPSDKYFVVVYNADEGANELPSNNSPGFTIEKAEIPSVIVLAPNGGEQWLTNNSFEISWIANNIENVKIEYSTNGGGSWKTISTNTPNDGTYNWVPTDNDSSDNSVVRISDEVTGTPTDLSDNVFSIHKNKKVRVVSPNGGESYKNGSIEIIWTTFAVSRVNVYYSIDNGVTWVPLQSNIQSTGGYVWVYPAGMISGQARIKVEDASNAALYDVSDGFFYIGVDKPMGSVSPKAEIKKLPKK